MWSEEESLHFIHHHQQHHHYHLRILISGTTKPQIDQLYPFKRLKFFVLIQPKLPRSLSSSPAHHHRWISIFFTNVLILSTTLPVSYIYIRRFLSLSWTLAQAYSDSGDRLLGFTQDEEFFAFRNGDLFAGVLSLSLSHTQFLSFFGALCRFTLWPLLGQRSTPDDLQQHTYSETPFQTTSD